MRIDVWSDILCPFCHLGRRHLELALEQFEHADEIGVVWHSFMLDADAATEDSRPLPQLISEKYGMSLEDAVAQHERMAADAAEVGLDFQWESIVVGNSFDAHRLIHFARSVGREEEVTARVMRGWYGEGASIGDHDTLVRLAVDAGLEEGAVRDLLAGEDHGIDVRTDIALARQIGITAVPTFVLDQAYAVSGAQPVEVMLGALRQVWDLQGTQPEPAAAGGGCGGGCCGGGCGGEAEADSAPEAQACGCGDGGCGEGAGICGSDLHLVELGPRPTTLGHEIGGLLDGRPAISRLALADEHDLPVRIAGQVDDAALAEAILRRDRQ